MSVSMRRETLLNLIVLFAVFVGFFYFRGGFLPGQAGCDEPSYIQNAVRLWSLRAGTPVLFSPLYHDIITPFVAIFFDAERGFIVWRFLILLATSVLLYFNVAALARPWIALVVTIHFQLVVMVYMTGTYFVLAMAWVLIANLILMRRPDNVGMVAGLLLLGLHVRGELFVVCLAFLALCLAFAPRVLFTRRFVLQLAPFALIFVGLIYWHQSSLSEFPKVFAERGSLAFNHYVGKTMFELGYLKKYTDKSWGQIDFDVLDRAYRDYFGKTLTQFREQGGLNMVEMYEANPEIMTKYYHRVFGSSLDTIPEAFAPDITYAREPASIRQRVGDMKHVALVRDAIHLVFLALALLPFAVDRLRRKVPEWRCAPLSRQAVLLILAPWSAFATWFLTMPEAHYVVFIVPTTYLSLVLLGRWLLPAAVCRQGGE